LNVDGHGVDVLYSIVFVIHLIFVFYGK